MSKPERIDHYFKFPLAILHGGGVPATPLGCIELALDCGIHGAGKGFKHHQGHEAFKIRLEELCDKLEMVKLARPGPTTTKGEVLVGADICNVTLGSYHHHNLESIADNARRVATGGPLVCMKGDFFWAALNQAEAESDPESPWPDKGVSWREFRILCAILSVKTNRAGFAFMGWETIQARSCGFTTKDAFRKADVIPDHLAPPLSRDMIRTTCDTLEALGFFARFRLSRGKVGGKMAYSFRHKERAKLAEAVCEFVNFRARVGIRENRASDAAKCLELLESPKSSPSHPQQPPQASPNTTPNIKRNPMGEKSHDEKSKLSNRQRDGEEELP